MDVSPLHECPPATTGGFDLLVSCDGETLSAGATAGIIIGAVVVLAAIGFGVYWLIKRRRYDE